MAVGHVAAELSITPNNAMVRLHRARTALKARLKEHCGTDNARSCTDCGCEERGCCPAP
jgi:RNA polymerase sigma-70 factor (ECF subfamily)